MAFKSLLIQRVEKLENHKDIKNHAGIKKQLAGLKKEILHKEKISGQYSEVVSLMADGMSYDDAMREAGLMKGYE